METFVLQGEAFVQYGQLRIKMKYSTYVLVVLVTLFCFSCVKQQLSEKEQFVGSYLLTAGNGDEYEMKLVVGENDALFGYYEHKTDSITAREIIYPEYQTEDSLRLRTRFGGHFLELGRENGVFSGQADLFGDTLEITFQQISTDPGAELKQKAAIEEVEIGLVRPQFPTFKEDGSFYIIGKPSMEAYDVSNIYLINKVNNETYQSKRVEFDQQRYRFTGIGLSPDEQTLVASGIENSEAHTTGSDIFLIHLKNRSGVNRVEHLGGIVNTPSYEIFPSFSPDGDILYASGGNPAGGEVKGRADLFIARKNGDKYTPGFIGDGFNTDQGDASPLMDYQGRFIIFYRKAPGGGYINYISEKSDSGWLEPKQLTGMMKNVSAYGLRIDRQGKYLYFTSFFQGPGKLFRVHTDEVPKLKSFFNSNKR